MDRQTAKSVIAEVETALQEIMTKHGLKLDRGIRARFGSEGIRLTVPMVNVQVQETRNSNILAQFGLDDLKVFTIGGVNYHLNGETRPGRYDIWLMGTRDRDGRLCRFKPEQVKEALRRNASMV